MLREFDSLIKNAQHYSSKGDLIPKLPQGNGLTAFKVSLLFSTLKH